MFELKQWFSELKEKSKAKKKKAREEPPEPVLSGLHRAQVLSKEPILSYHKPQQDEPAAAATQPSGQDVGGPHAGDTPVRAECQEVERVLEEPACRSLAPSSQCPAFAAESLVGRRYQMEDSWTGGQPLLIQRALLTDVDHLPPPRVFHAPARRERPLSAPKATSTSSCTPGVSLPGANATSSPGLCATPCPASSNHLHTKDEMLVHFFAVYDGHGGSDVATHCSRTLHEHLRKIVGHCRAAALSDGQVASHAVTAPDADIRPTIAFSSDPLLIGRSDETQHTGMSIPAPRKPRSREPHTFVPIAVLEGTQLHRADDNAEHLSHSHMFSHSDWEAYDQPSRQAKGSPDTRVARTGTQRLTHWIKNHRAQDSDSAIIPSELSHSLSSVTALDTTQAASAASLSSNWEPEPPQGKASSQGTLQSALFVYSLLNSSADMRVGSNSSDTSCPPAPLPPTITVSASPAADTGGTPFHQPQLHNIPSSQSTPGVNRGQAASANLARRLNPGSRMSTGPGGAQAAAAGQQGSPGPKTDMPGFASRILARTLEQQGSQGLETIMSSAGETCTSNPTEHSDQPPTIGAALSRAAGCSASSIKTCTSVEESLRRAFIQTDRELADAGDVAKAQGSTAVVALVGPDHLWIANCGDSRAVLCRETEAVVMSADHKACREDEMGRVQAAGGYVWWNRVMGELAVSRSIGDHTLRPWVIAEPEVTRVTRRPTDRLLILATDGLWDVITNQEACDMALETLNRYQARGYSSSMCMRKISETLSHSALSRGSRDNVTVLVVDLQPGSVVTPCERPNSSTKSSPLHRLPNSTKVSASAEGMLVQSTPNSMLVQGSHRAKPVCLVTAAQANGGRISQSASGSTHYSGYHAITFQRWPRSQSKRSTTSITSSSSIFPQAPPPDWSGHEGAAGAAGDAGEMVLSAPCAQLNLNTLQPSTSRASADASSSGSGSGA